jgi:hypothetical protein
MSPSHPVIPSSSSGSYRDVPGTFPGVVETAFRTDQLKTCVTAVFISVVFVRTWVIAAETPVNAVGPSVAFVKTPVLKSPTRVRDFKTRILSPFTRVYVIKTPVLNAYTRVNAA